MFKYNSLLFLLNRISTGVNIQDLTDKDVIKNLKVADFLSDVFRDVGSFIYIMLYNVVNFMSDCFNETVNFSVMDVLEIDEIKLSVTDIAWMVLLIMTLCMLVLKMIDHKRNFDFMKNLFLIVMCLSVFGSFCELAQDMKTAGIQVVDVVTTKADMNLAESIFHDNVYDMQLSTEKDEMTPLNDKISSWSIDYNEIMSKGTMQGKMTYDTDGKVEYVDLRDGVMGIGDERYFRYKIDFGVINTSLAVMSVFYIIGLLKIAYISVDLFFKQLFSPVVMTKSVSSFDKVLACFSSILKSMASAVFVYFSMMIFPMFTKAIFNADLMWLNQIIFVGVMGFVGVVGSGWITKELGLDDGSQFIMKSMFMGRAMSRTAKGIADTAGKVAGNVGDFVGTAGKTIGDVGGKWAEHERGKWQDMYNDHNQKMGDIQRGSMYQNAKNAPKELGNRYVNNDPKQLGNMDTSNKPIYGNDGYDPNNGDGYNGGNFHTHDSSDQYNEMMDETKDRFMDKYDNHMGTVDGQENNAHEVDSFAKDTNHAKTSNSNLDMPVDYGKYKPYSAYKKDYAMGDESIEKTQSSQPGKMPSWYIDDMPSPAHEDTSHRNFDENKYNYKLKKMNGEVDENMSFEEYMGSQQGNDKIVYNNEKQQVVDLINGLQRVKSEMASADDLSFDEFMSQYNESE